MNLFEIVEKAHATALDKGFWSSDPGYRALLSQKVALIHSEASEALEVLRRQTPSGIVNYREFGEEMADIIIRVADLAGFLRIDLDQMVSDKMEKNKSRPTRHGKAF